MLRRTCRLFLQGWRLLYPENWGSDFFRNVVNGTPVYKASFPRSQ